LNSRTNPDKATRGMAFAAVAVTIAAMAIIIPTVTIGVLIYLVI